MVGGSGEKVTGSGLTRLCDFWRICWSHSATCVGVSPAPGCLPQLEALPDVGQQGIDDTYLFLLPRPLPDCRAEPQALESSPEVGRPSQGPRGELEKRSKALRLPPAP